MPRHPPPEITKFKSHNQRRLVECAKLMFGDYWQRPACKALGVHVQTMARWTHGDSEPPDEVVEQLAAMARQRAAELKRAANR